MRFSELQKHTLLYCFGKSDKCNREPLVQFYKEKMLKPKQKDLVSIITKSIERLIEKELIIGYGVRTPHKWFIKEIKLTPKGKRFAKKLLGEQQKLPLK